VLGTFLDDLRELSRLETADSVPGLEQERRRKCKYD
jgi:hypothetical protein